MEKVIRCISGVLIIISILLLLLTAWLVPYGETRIVLRESAREYRSMEKELTEEAKNQIASLGIVLDQSVKNIISDIKDILDLIIDGELKPTEMVKITRFAIKYSGLAKEEIELNPLVSSYIDPAYTEKIIDGIEKVKLVSFAYLACFVGAVVFGVFVLICRLIGKGPRSGWLFFIFNAALIGLFFLLCRGLESEAELQFNLTHTAWLALALSVPLPLKMVSRKLSERSSAAANVGMAQISRGDIGYLECRVCGTKNRMGSKFCCNCGSPLEREE